MKIIKLTKGFETFVDDEDYDKLTKFPWLYDQGYARRMARKKERQYSTLRSRLNGRLQNTTTLKYLTV